MRWLSHKHLQAVALGSAVYKGLVHWRNLTQNLRAPLRSDCLGSCGFPGRRCMYCMSQFQRDRDLSPTKTALASTLHHLDVIAPCEYEVSDLRALESSRPSHFDSVAA